MQTKEQQILKNAQGKNWDQSINQSINKIITEFALRWPLPISYEAYPSVCLYIQGHNWQKQKLPLQVGVICS